MVGSLGRFTTSVVLSASLASAATAAHAEPSPNGPSGPSGPSGPGAPNAPAASIAAQPHNAFDRHWGLSAHYAYWDGSYASQGVGFRTRWEPLEYFGLELSLDVLGSAGQRVDVPFGFFLYAPIALTHNLRVRPLAGLCGMITAADKGTPDGKRNDDVQVGFRLGGGVEFALNDAWSLYADATWQRYYGHAHDGAGWASNLSGDIVPTDRLAVAVGLGFHL